MRHRLRHGPVVAESSTEHDSDGDCKRAKVGEPDLVQAGGFAVKGDDSKCSSLLFTVLDYHLGDMVAEDAIQREWKRHRDLIADNVCTLGGGDTDEELRALTIKDLDGVFILHATLMVVALIVCIYEHYRKVNHGVDRKTTLPSSPKHDESDHSQDNLVKKVELREMFTQFKTEMSEELRYDTAFLAILTPQLQTSITCQFH